MQVVACLEEEVAFLHEVVLDDHVAEGLSHFSMEVDDEVRGDLCEE